MAEDFSTYTEEDPNTRITVASTRVTTASIARNEDAWVYVDKGSGAFSGNFTHLLTVKATGGVNDGWAYFWALTNTVDDVTGIDAANGSCLALGYYVYNSAYQLYLEEVNSGTQYISAHAITINTPYYLKIVRDEGATTYGTLYGYVYSDSARTTLLGTMTINLKTPTKDYRYIFAASSHNNGTAETISGYCENLTLEDAQAPTVTTQAVDDIEVTTATGHGTITSLGSAAVTQHGHCWNTSTNPTTANSKTSKGTGSVGPFISLLTSLSSNTLYYVRAYATNSLGTSYGDNVTFTTATTDMPTVETKDCTALTGTTATGVGIIWSVGGSEVTEHGHCWATTINPDTDDSKTTKGFGYYGAFTSAITGLSASTSYYIRAYATNTAGTAYGNNVRIVAGTGGSELAGPIAVVGTGLHYVDKYGVEKYIEGTPV